MTTNPRPLNDWEWTQIQNLRRLHDCGLTDTDLEFLDDDIRFLLAVKKMRQCGEKMAIVHIDERTSIRSVGQRKTI